jgi:hypothetical protein
MSPQGWGHNSQWRTALGYQPQAHRLRLVKNLQGWRGRL